MTKYTSITFSSHFKDNTLDNANIPTEYYEKYVPESTLKNADNFGKIWWQYNGIKLNGKEISVKFTAVSWNNSSLRYNYLGARTNGTMGGFYPRNTRIKVTFLDTSTGNPVSLKGNLSARDFDSSTVDSNIEKMTLHNGIDRVYLGEWMVHDGQTLYNNHGADVSASETRAWATLCFNGSSFEFTYTKGGFCGFYRTGDVAVTKVYKITTKGTNATITASMKDIEEGSTKTVTWTPKAGYRMKSVTIDGVAQTNVNPEGATYTFSNINANHTVTVVAEPIPTYTITTEGTHATITPTINDIQQGETKTVTWSPDAGYRIKSVTIDGVAQTNIKPGGDSYTFSNINADHEVKVIAEPNPTYKITTAGTHASITPTETDITEGANRTITWSPDSGYYIQSVTVDGKAQNVNPYGGSYTFSNINANHDVKVVAVAQHKITTSVVNGTITPSMSGIIGGENRTVSFSPKDGYVLKSITIDGAEQDISKYKAEESDKYVFNNITSDHDIKVVYEMAKNREISITKRIKKSDVVWANGNPTFVFHLTGTDIEGRKHAYNQTAVLKNTTADTEGYISVTVKFKNLAAGTYDSTEKIINRYQFSTVDALSNATKDGQKVTYNVVKNKSASARYTNTKTNWQYFTHNDSVINDCGKK